MIWRLMLKLIGIEPEPEEKPMKEETPDEYCDCLQPGLKRIVELGWKCPCGHSPHLWNSAKHRCEGCLAEGRVIERN